jgi:hypothetical protein
MLFMFVCRTGRCSYPDGSSYDGDWRADERSGWGSLRTADGQQYEGEWQHNKPQGEACSIMVLIILGSWF